MPKPKACTLYIVRHGQTEWNLRRKIQGHADSPLTKEGVSNLRKLGDSLKKVQFAAVFSSDSQRAKRSADIITLEKNIAITTSKLLREKSYGKYEGIEFADFQKKLKKHLEHYQELKTDQQRMSFKYPDIESDETAVARFITFLREISIGYPGKNVLVVTHGGPIKILLIHLGFATYEQFPSTVLAIGNSALVKLSCDGVDFKILQTVGINKTDSSSTINH